MASGASLVQAVVDGITNGASYAILALAFSLLWATVRTVNMALLQCVTIGGFFAYEGASHGAVVAVVYGVLAATVAGLITHYVAVAPTLRKGQIYPIIASLGAGLLIQGALSWGFGDSLRSLPQVLPIDGSYVGSIFIGWNAVVVVCIVAFLLIVAAGTMRFTSVGLAFRAASWAPGLANAYGVNVPSVRLVSAAGAGALAGLAGVFVALLGGSVDPTLGASVGLTGIVAMLIGGAGNLVGAVFGGLAVGVIESLSGQFVSTSLSQAVSYAVLFLVMVVRPSGLMRER